MRLALAAFLLAVSAPLLAQPVIAVSVYSGDAVTEPQLVLPLPEEGQTIEANYPSESGPCAPGAHKVQQWVKVSCPAPMALSLTREGNFVKVKLGLREYGVTLNANTSATESVALDFKNFEPTKKVQARVETVMEN